MTDNSEARLQQQCYMWFHNNYPQHRGLFFKIKNEGYNAIRGARDKATGIVPGVGDMCLLVPNDRACFFEFKTEVGKQSLVQKEWEAKVKVSGHYYFLIKTLETFQYLCHKLLD